MERKKPLPQPSSSSDESTSDEEEGNEQFFVRSDRGTMKVEDKKALEADEDEDGDEDEDEDDDDDAFDGTQRGNANAVAEEDSSSETKQAGPGDGGSGSDSSTSSASEGKSDKPSHRFVVLPSKPESANGNGKKAPAPEKPSKSRPKAEFSLKKGKDKASKRDRDVEPQEKGSSKKHKKESIDKPSKSVEHLPDRPGKSIEHVSKAKDAEKVSKEENTPSHTREKKNDGKKSVHATALAEKSKKESSQQNSSKKPENASSKKAVEKSKNDKKVVKDPEPEPLKGPLSPVKPKLFTAKDEMVLTREILHDIKQGIEIPVKKIDGYWSLMFDRVKGRMEQAWSKEQLCEKVKRMKVRYTTMAEKFKDSEERKFRNSTDKELFGLWDQIWGSGDAMKVDYNREVAEVKDKQTKGFVAASPVRGKVSRDKVIAPVLDVKVVHEESEGRKSKHTQKQSSDEDASESEESEREGGLRQKDLTVTPMEVDHACADNALVPEGNAIQGHENSTHIQSISDAQNLFQEKIRATLLELQESSKQTLKEWQTKALAVTQNAVKAAVDHSRLVNGIGVGGFDGLFTPYRSLDLLDLQQTEGDQALQQQWHELRLKELDVYRQKLELMQRECQLKQDQLELQLHRTK